MKKALVLLVSVFLMLSALTASADEAPVSGLKKDIVVLFTSDIHCGTDTGFGLGAMIQAKKHFEKDNYVVLADGGDTFQGVYAEGALIAALMEAVGYDVATLGNHEFDYGVEGMEPIFDIMDCPHVCVNYFKDGKPVFPPYIIKEFDGVKVAFVGALTPKTNTSANPARFRDSQGSVYTFATDGTGDELVSLIQKAVDDARAEGADYVVLLSHLGNGNDDGPYTSKSVIHRVSGVDAVLDGHSHDTEFEEYTDKDGKTVPRQGAGTKMEAIVCLRIGKDGKLSMEVFHWEDKVPAMKLLGYKNRATVMQKIIDMIMLQMYNEKVGSTNFDLHVYDFDKEDEDGKPLRIVRNHETNCGDLIADAIRAATGADLAVINGGSVRDEIPKGDITIGNLYKVVPFMDHVTSCKCSGQVILDMLELSVSKMPDEFGGFLQVSGVTFDVRTDIPSPVVMDKDGNFEKISGERRVSNVKINGKPLDVNGEYTLGSVEAIIREGINGYTMFKNCEFIDIDMPLDVEAVTAYITDNLKGVVDARYANTYGEGRINIIGETESSGDIGSDEAAPSAKTAA